MKEFTIKRTRDLLAECRRIAWGSAEGATIAEVIAKATKSRPSGYTVGYEYARRMIRYVQAHPTEARAMRKYAFWRELCDKVDEYVRTSGADPSDALMQVLDNDAPSSFNISPATARNIYYRALSTKSKS